MVSTGRSPKVVDIRRGRGTAGDATTSVIIAVVTTLCFMLQYYSGWEPAISYAAGFLPGRVGHPDLLDATAIGLPIVPTWLTPLSASLLHGSWMHLGFNMLILLYCGRQVEMVLGRGAYLLLYILGAYGAALGQWALGPNVMIPMIGASGAISAVIGAYALLYSSREVPAFGPIPANIVRMAWLGAGWIFLQFLVGLASRGGGMPGSGGDAVAVGAHAGGFILGMILVRPLLRIRFGRSVRH